MAGKKKIGKMLTVQVGKARPTDMVFDMKVNQTLGNKLRKLASDGVLEINPDQLLPLIGLQISGALDQGIDLGDIAQVINATPPNVLDTAKDIIYGDREQAYGNPRFNLDTIAQFWTTYLQRKFPQGMEPIPHFYFTAEDVAQFMILLKMGRLIHNPTHFDSLVDQAGYAALQHRIQSL